MIANRTELWRMVSQMTRDGEPMETILTALRNKGAREIDSIKALRDGAGLSLVDAKRTLHFSDTWADSRKRTEKFWDELEQIASEEFPKGSD